MLRSGLRPQKLYNVSPFRPTRLHRIRHASSTPPKPRLNSATPSPIWDSLALYTRVLSWASGVVLAFHITSTYIGVYAGCYGISMLPNFASFGDCVLISKWYRRGRGVQVGDIVSFAHPVDEGEEAIKRVLGMPGDFVLRDTPGKGKGLMVQVPQGHCWVAGDNQEWSRDSRMYGPLPLALVKGRVTHRVQPWSWPVRVERGLTSPMAEEEDEVD